MMGFMKHLRYLRYVIRHKWYVFVECCRLGIPLAGVAHDWSKFLPSEWGPYVEKFYGSKESTEALCAIGEFGCAELAPYGYFVQDRFNVAWNHHQKRNPHHWNYWVLVNDNGDIINLPMPDRYRREMVADWTGAGIAITGKRDVAKWYRKNYDKIRLHSETRRWVDELLSVKGNS